MWLWVVGCGLLVVGYGLLVMGCWLLVLLNVNTQSNDLTIYLPERPYHNK